MMHVWCKEKSALFFVLFALVAAGYAAEVKHEFIAVDNGRNNLIYLNQLTDDKWVTAIPDGSRDIQLLGDDKILVSHGNGCAEYYLSSGEKAGWEVTEFSNVNTARRLPNGNTMLGANTNGITFYEISPDRQEVAKIELPSENNLRLMRVYDGNVLFNSAAGGWRVKETNSDGEIVWEATLPQKGYKAIKLPNGNVLATSGEDARIVELDHDSKEIVWEAGGESNFEGLDWFSGFDTLANGNVVCANWLGHGKHGTGPHLVEFDEDNNLVWSWEDHETAAQITNVLILDDKNPDDTPVLDPALRVNHHGPDRGVELRIMGVRQVRADPRESVFSLRGRRVRTVCPAAAPWIFTRE